MPKSSQQNVQHFVQHEKTRRYKTMIHLIFLLPSIPLERFDAGTSIPQRLQSLGSLVLRQFAGESDHGKTTLQERRLQMPDSISRIAEHERAWRLEKA